MTNLIKHLAILVCVVMLPMEALAQDDGISIEGGSGSIGDGFLAGGSFFLFQDESKLGENELNNGLSTFLRFDMQYNFSEYFSGIGLFYELNSFGDAQKDTITGIIFEIFAGNFLFNYLYGINVEQKFENRSFSSRKGTSSAIELGIRAPLFFNMSYYEVKIHRRTVTIDKEDGRDMESKYELTQTMPMLSVGVNL